MSTNEMHDKGRSLRNGLLTNLGGSVFFGLSGFVFAVVLSISQGAEAAGRFWAALAVYNIVGRSAELGTASGLVRFASQSSAQENPAAMKRYLHAAFLPVMTAGVLGAGLLMLLAFTVFANDGSADETLLAFAFSVPIAAMYTPIVQSLRGFGSMRSNVVIDRFARGLLQPGSVMAVFALNGTIPQAAIAWGAATLLLLLMAGRSLAIEIRCDVPSTEAKTEFGERSGADARSEFWTFTRPRVLGQLSEVLLLWVDVLIVGLILGDRAAGIYAAVSRFAVVGMFIAEAIMKVAGPQTAALIARHRQNEVGDLLADTARAQAGIVWPVYLVLIVFAPQVSAWFGPEFTEGALALRILAAGLLTSSLFGPVSGVVLMSGRSREARRASVAALACNVVLNLALVPLIGIAGAAVAWSASFVVVGVMNTRIAASAGFGAPLHRSVAVAARSAAVTGTAALAAAIFISNAQLALGLASLVGAINILLELARTDFFTPNQNPPMKTSDRAAAPQLSSL